MGLVNRLLSAAPSPSSRHASGRLIAERLQIEHAAARADGWQQPAGLRRDQKKESARRRLLERFQQRIGGVDVELIGDIDNYHPMRTRRACASRTSGRGAPRRRESRPETALLLGSHGRRRTADPGCDSASTWRAAIVSGAIRANDFRTDRARLRVRQHMARKTIGQRCLADALVPAISQPWCMRPEANISASMRLGTLMAIKAGRRAGMRRVLEPVRLGRASISCMTGARAIKPSPSAKCSSTSSRISSAIASAFAGAIDHAASRRLPAAQSRCRPSRRRA